MSDDNAVIEMPRSNKSNKEALSESSNSTKKRAQKNIFLREIEMNSVKQALLTEIDVSKIRDSLIVEIKEALLKEIDVSGIKEALLKEINVKELISGESKENKSSSSDEDYTMSTKLRKKAEKESTKAVAPVVKKRVVNLPGYKYGLVDSCVKDHQEILSIYESIMGCARDKDYNILPLMLSQFSKKCFNHFNEEEQLYTFMKALAGSRSDTERKVAIEFSTEMKNISLELFTILNQSNYIPVNDNTVEGFLEEFIQLGEILQERMGREETILYPMYESSRQVVDIC